jgi:hypothetical protein
VRGLLREKSTGRNVRVLVNDKLEVGRDREVKITGNLTEEIEGEVSRVRGKTEESTEGSYTHLVKGDITETATANRYLAAGGAHTLQAGEDVIEEIGGRKVVYIGNSQFPTGSLTAYKLFTVLGEIDVVAAAGKVKITAGGTSDLPMAQITLKPTGAIKITSPVAKTVSFELNPLGAKISTPAGSISIDNVGTVSLGPTAGQAPVVTTLSHPTDYVTGAPIFGSISVSAGGVPGLVSLPSSFVPDPT